MYHPNNLIHQPFPHWRVKLLALIGWTLGVQFKIGGMPYGAEYNKRLWEAHYSTENANSGVNVPTSLAS